MAGDADDAVAGSEVESGERWLLSPFCCRERWLIRLRFRGVPAVAEAEAPMWKRFSLERSEAGCSVANMGLAKTATAVFITELFKALILVLVGGAPLYGAPLLFLSKATRSKW